MPGLDSIIKNIPQFLRSKTKKQMLGIYLVVLIIVLVLFVFIFLKPSLAKLYVLIPKVQAFRTDIKNVSNDLLFEDNLKKQIQTLQVKLDEYGKKLSREKEIPMLLENLSSMARNSNVKIQSITPLSKRRTRENDSLDKGERVYQEVPIAITAQSGYHELGDLISRLESDERFMQVSDMEIKASKSNPAKHDIEFLVYIYTFQGIKFSVSSLYSNSNAIR